MDHSGRENWGGRIGYILGASGFAIGLGNIWRFSYVAGKNGGGAFLLIYLLVIILIAIPLFLTESGLGRKSQAGAIMGMRKLTKKGSPWVAIGWLGAITAILITSYFLMITGWVLAYLFKIMGGSLQGVSPEKAATIYEGLISSPWAVIAYTIVIAVIIGIILSRGVKKGIESFSKIVMPLLFITLVIMAIYSITLPGSLEGIIWYLKPDFSQISSSTILEAVGQAFFSIGIGFAAAFAYGSYLNPKKSNLVADGIWVVGLDTFVAFMMGLVIFPALFAFGIAPDSGSGLLFVTMPTLMEQMPFGTVFGFVFFFLVLIAAITTAMGLVEGVAVNVSELFKLKRKTSVWLSVGVTFILSIPSILSQGPWSHIRIFGMDIFEFVDYFSGNVLLTLGGLLLSLFVVFYWKFKHFRDDINIGANAVRIPKASKPLFIVVIPVVIVFILVTGLV